MWIKPTIPTMRLIWWLVSLETHCAWAVPTDTPSASSFFVSNLPDLHQDPSHPLQMYAGHIVSDPNASSANSSDVVLAHLFFVMIKARREADKERLMFWFNGGPGCSSLNGLMMEVGPWRVDGHGGLKTVGGGWEEYTTMVYVDQPAGTGLSYTSTNRHVHTLNEATDHVIQFIRTFYQGFPEYLSVDAYLGGESFSGQYIPYFADAILASDLNIPLRGAAIGNGWIDARSQYSAYLEYAVARGIIDVQSQEYKDSETATEKCLSEFNRMDHEPIRVGRCEKLTNSVLDSRVRTVDGKMRCINVYDVRLEDEFPACGKNWPPDLKDITTYLARPDVVKALHARGKSESWVECSGHVRSEMHFEFSPSSITLLPSLIERIPVLLFVGDQDYICNYLGIEKMIDVMTWKGETGLGGAESKPWVVNGTPAGTWVSSRNLTYVKVFNASHMVPYDVPDVAHDMILRFMGVNFSATLEGSARIPSSVGDDAKPIFSDDEIKVYWNGCTTYYNVGTATLIGLFLAIWVGVCMWCRLPKRRIQLSRSDNVVEESIPLHLTAGDDVDSEYARQKRGNEWGRWMARFGAGDDDED